MQEHGSSLLWLRGGRRMSHPVYRFGRTELKPATRQLIVDGRELQIGPRTFDVLVALVERRDRMVPKSELLDAVWPDLDVEENNLQVQVSSLRRVLGPGVIATVPGRGYRFEAPLLEAPATDPQALHRPDPAAAVAPGVRRPERAGVELPGLRHAIIGRQADEDQLLSLVERHRLVTVVGAGGIGKTSLALCAAARLVDRFDGRVCVVELASARHADDLPEQVARVLGILLPGGPADTLARLADGVGV